MFGQLGRVSQEVVKQVAHGWNRGRHPFQHFEDGAPLLLLAAARNLFRGVKFRRAPFLAFVGAVGCAHAVGAGSKKPLFAWIKQDGAVEILLNASVV